MRTVRFWTEQRQQTLKELFLLTTALSTGSIVSASVADRIIAEKLGTTAAAVTKMRTKLGLKHPEPDANRGRPKLAAE